MNRDEMTKDLSQDALKLLRYGSTLNSNDINTEAMDSYTYDYDIDKPEKNSKEYRELYLTKPEINMTDCTYKELEPFMNEITEEIFYDFLYMRNNIIDLIEEKTKELSIILHDRLPIGEMCDVDIWESEFKPGCIFVEFEEYYGESYRDQFNLPIRFLYDKDYPNIFKKENDAKNKLIETNRIIDEAAKKLAEDVQLERFELSEYERLKSKYE